MSNVPKTLVYSTPYAATWKAYCDTFLHSLVCIDRTEDIGVVVYSYNEITGNISGQLLEKWSEREKWCLEKLTLNGSLPLDVIESAVVSKTFSGKRKDTVIEICGSRYYKINQDSSSTFTTRLVSKGGVYSCNNGSIEHNVKLLEIAGFLEHENCIPYLAKSKGTTRSKADAQLRKAYSLDINTESLKTVNILNVKEKLLYEAKQFEEVRKPLLLELKRKEEEIKSIKQCKDIFKNCGTVPLADLKQGFFTVKAAKKLATRFGTSYKLLLEDGKDCYLVWSNRCLTDIFDKLLENDLVNKDGDFLSLEGQPLGVLTVTGKGTNQYGNVSVYCTFTRTSIDKTVQVLPPVLDSITLEVPTITRENLLSYRAYKNIITFPIGSTQKIDAVGYITHYGT